MLSRTLLVLANGPGSDQTHEWTCMEVSRPGNPKAIQLKVAYTRLRGVAWARAPRHE